MKPTLFGLNPQKFSLKKCLIFFPENTCSEKVCFRKRKIFSPSPKNKKIHPEKNSYASGNRNAKKLIFFSKLFLYFRKKLSVLENQKKKKIILFLYKEAKFSKTKCFFLLYKIFFHIQQMFVFHLLRHFCNVQDHIVNFFLFLL